VNLAQLRTEVGRRAGIDADPVAVTQLLNDALATISADGPWPWMESKTTLTTVANQTDYTLPASLLTVRAVLVDGREADPIALADADNYLNQDSPTLTFGTGDLYSIRNSTLIILPAPASAGKSIVVEYTATEPTLAGDSDTPLLPTPYHYIVAVLAASFLLERKTTHVGRGALAQFSIFKRQYDDWKTAQTKIAVRSNGGPRVPRVRPGAAW
jgi:hypothetical protein